MKSLNIRKQQGLASVLFVLLIPALFGFFAFSVEGIRYIHTKARLADVTEIASLALTARDSEDDVGNIALVKDYVDSLMTDAKDDIVISFTSLTCDEIPGCGTPGVYDESGFNFSEVQLSITTKHDTWFKANSIDDIRFDDEQVFEGKAVARKYQPQPVDVVFVTDFGSSMNQNFIVDSKFNELTGVLSEVAEEVESYTENSVTGKNTVGMAPFNSSTIKKIGGSRCIITHLCPTGQSACDGSNIPNNESGVDYSKTLNKIFVEKNTCLTGSKKFNSLSLTTDVTGFMNEIINDMSPSGFSQASYDGLIEGAQIVEKGDNPRRLLVFLSDGTDNQNGSKAIMTKLINDGLCNEIRNTLDQKTTSEGKSVISKIAVIGIDYDFESDPTLANCAGSENVFTAANMTAVKNILLKLISEEIGRLYSYN